MHRPIDLHAHTTHSDGSLTPTELVDLAAEVGLAALALTDHDTTGGLPEARAAAERHGIEVLAGCEITAGVPAGVAHVLAYAFDEEHDAFQGLLSEVRAGRDERNDRIHAKLEKLGVPVSEEDVRKHAVGCIVARPLFAMAMVDRGHVDTMRQAFDHYLRDRGPAYARAPVPSAEEAIGQVVAAGGVAVLAHPRSLKLGGEQAYREAFTRMRDAGLVGLEVDHPSQDAKLRRQFGALADELGLERSGGSDFHGAHKPGIALGTGNGTIAVTYATWARLLARAGSAA
ncbi:MAG: PHP domain-containing protein [Planctomycetota bacterium]|nr:PHP domain-containing protein [Planctomycetota bacterium]